jgi:hypothetical protein
MDNDLLASMLMGMGQPQAQGGMQPQPGLGTTVGQGAPDIMKMMMLRQLMQQKPPAPQTSAVPLPPAPDPTTQQMQMPGNA